MPPPGRPRKTEKCKTCGDPHFAKGLCRYCYDEARAPGRARAYRERRASDSEFRKKEIERVREAVRRHRRRQSAGS
ncbi:MAG TPA: hypothetical protein QGH28_07960 [Chloroflexota bacterium]|nr:hypothetical protein [Chloroflexota bacterium]